MGKCVIFCAAGFDALAAPLEKDDYIIAADGGLEHTRKLGIQPHPWQTFHIPGIYLHRHQRPDNSD